MTHAKKISFALLITIVVMLFAYRYWNTDSLEPHVEPITVTENMQNTSTAQANNNTAPLVHMAEPKTKLPLQAGKKHYDDDWCIANEELSESDLLYAKAELKDWYEALGMASIGIDKTSSKHVENYSNYVYVEPYESLPINELQTLALDGNKWAMVAFVQDDRADFSYREEVAKQLMVQGASYYALQYLTMKSLSDAYTKANSENSEQDVTKHIVDALVYVFWGLESYNEGAIDVFLQLASTPVYKEHLPFEKVFLESSNQVNQRLEELKNWILKERTDKGITAPEPPAAISKLIANKIAFKESLYADEMKQLRQLNVSATKKIQITPCIEKFMEKTAKHSSK